MSRKKKSAEYRRVRTREELLAEAAESLDLLADYCRNFDEGRSAYHRPMATELHNLLTGNAHAMHLRASSNFATPDFDNPAGNLVTYNKLVAYGMTGGDDPHPVFVAQYRKQSGDEKTRELPFVEWWSREEVYHAGSSPVDFPDHGVAIGEANMLAVEDRRRLTRREIVDIVRNTRAAHQGTADVELDRLDRVADWPFFGDPEASHGRLRYSPLAAMVRQIAHEALIAFGRADTLSAEAIPVPNPVAFMPVLIISDDPIEPPL